MPERIPSLKALRAFEAVVRHMSFKAAAEELCVTPAAISHLIKTLEEDLQDALFIRLNGGLKLTAMAKSIYPELQEGFLSIERAFQNRIKQSNKHKLKVAVAPAFSTKWLVPNVSKFIEAHPDVDIDIHAAHECIDYKAEQIDIGIRYGLGYFPGLISEKLLSDSLIPVCAPYLVKSTFRKTLEESAVIHDDSIIRFNSKFPDWFTWLKHINWKGNSVKSGPRFNTASNAIEAAIQGAGVLLTRRSLVMDDIAQRKLVHLFNKQLPIEQGFHIVYEKSDLQRREVSSFHKWLTDLQYDSGEAGLVRHL